MTVRLPPRFWACARSHWSARKCFSAASEKGAEFALLAVDFRQEALGQEAGEELLRQVLGVFGGVAGPAHEGIEREPVALAQHGQRRLASGERLPPGADDHAPVRRGKAVPAGRQSFGFAVVGRHGPILGPQPPSQ